MNSSGTQTIVIDANTLMGGEEPSYQNQAPMSIKDIIVRDAPQYDISKAINDALLAISDVDENPSKGSALDFSPTRSQADYNGLWRARSSLIPYEYAKMIYNANSLLTIILNQQSHKVACFSRPQVNVSDVGYKLILRNPHDFRKLPKVKQEELMKRSAEMRDVLYNTGYKNDNDFSRRPKLPEMVKSWVHDGLLYGWCFTEVVKDSNGNPYCLSSVDTGTIYLPPENTSKAVSLANKSFDAIKNNDKLELKYIDLLEKLANNPSNYEFVQVIDGIPYTAFTPGKLLSETFYPSTDVMDAGYARPPLDAIIKAVSSNTNIDTHNNLVFSYGRAAKGFFVIKSVNIQEKVLQRMRQQFNANINGVERSFRTPVFALGPNDSLEWMPMDSTSTQGDFEYLSEITTRVIMGGYGVDPTEVPGQSHLQRPNAGQPIAESDNQFLSTAGAGTGFKLCLDNIQNMMNKVLNVFDPEVAHWFRFKFMGLNEDQPTKKIARAASAINVYADMNSIKHEFDEPAVPIGGNMPLAPQYLNSLSQVYSQNEIAAAFGSPEKLTDPTLYYYSNPLWMQYMSMFPELLKNRQVISDLMSSYLEELSQMFINKDS